MKYTLLQLTQEVLSAMDSDEVNSITDTSESLQVARIVRQAYFDLIEDMDPPEHYTMFELNASGDATRPTLMTVPDDVIKTSWVKYDCIASGETAPNYTLITYLPKEQFIERMYLLNTDQTNVGQYTVTTIDSSTIPIFFYNERAPLYYTSWDDKTIIFDAYDAAVDTTLQKNKTACYGRRVITFNLDDNYTPDLDEEEFPRLVNEAKILSFAELKSVQHAVADRNAKRARSRSFKNKFRVVQNSDMMQLPNYGRK